MPVDAIRVAVVDDEELVRAGMVSIISRVEGIDVVAEGSSGEDAIAICRDTPVDVILMDIKMPGIGGYGAVRTLSKVNTEVKILIVSVYSDDMYPTRLLQAGAKGYITKASSKAEMVRAIRSIHQGQHYICPDIANVMALKQIGDQSNNVFDQLSERELQVCLKIISGVKPQDIAEDFHLSAKTINSYRYRIFEKLGINNDVELTHLAVKHGLLSLIEDSPL
ncbi:MAG: response regulator [Pseudomonadota bacterium]|nr:response regulator [Pseudomonadota bacterium]